MQHIISTEHDVSQLSLCGLDSVSLVEYFGHGMEFYFRFVKFTGVWNLLYFLVSMIFLFINHDVDNQGIIFSTLIVQQSFQSYLYISIHMLLGLASIAYFYRFMTFVNSIEDPFVGQYDLNENINTWSIYIRTHFYPYLIYIRILVAIFFFALFPAYYYCQVALHKYVSTFSFVIAGQTLLSFSFVLVDFLWRLMCYLLSAIEAHKYQSSHRESDCAKSFFSRIVMFSIFIYTDTGTHVIKAQQMFNLLLFNTFFSPIMDLVSNYMYNKFCFFCCCGCDSVKADMEYKMAFNISDEYTQVLFRQYLINQCLLIMPIAPLIGAVGSCIEFYTDKFKLLHLCRRPERHDKSFVKIIKVFMIVNLCAILFAFPNGYIWYR